MTAALNKKLFYMSVLNTLETKSNEEGGHVRRQEILQMLICRSTCEELVICVS